MTHKPRTKEEVYQSLKDSLTGRIAKLTNFTDRSFNYVWTQAFSEEIHELEVLSLTSEFAGWIDFVGGPVTNSQLEDLGLADRVSADEINEIMEDDYLDEYVKIVGITRFEGSKATGTVTIDTQSRLTTIPKGTVVSTAPDSDGNTFSFETTEEVQTPDGVSTVSDVPIRAVDVGTNYNVPANTIVRFDEPPLGVTGVTNPESTTGGEERESNEELRERAKQQVEGASEGGTVEGIKAYLRQNVSAIGEGDVIIEEFVDNKPPFVDVIVDGGTDQEILDAIEASRPTGIRHNLIRPQVFQFSVRADLLGTDIETGTIEDEIETYLLDLGIGENLRNKKIINLILNRDEDIENIELLDITFDRVTNEPFTYSQNVDAAIAEDGGSFTTETTDANDDQQDDLTLLPQSPTTGDAYYFGNSSRFSGFDIFISTAGGGTWSFVWEYYNGSGWQQLSNVSDGTNGFQTENESSVTWDIPSDWVQATIDGEQQYFVRARLDTFTSISQQPLGQQVFITGDSYKLDLTYDNTNGSITLQDDDGNTYAKGADFEVRDVTGDGWPETIHWIAGQGSPQNGQRFFVDYDVTADATSHDNQYRTDLVRDETFVFENNRAEQYTYDQTEQQYRLDYVPFDGTSSITDELGNTYTEGTDYEIVSVGFTERDRTFTYDSSVQTYYLRDGIDDSSVQIIDANDNLYTKGTDYDTIDTDGDGIVDAIQWNTSNQTPSSGTEFTVTYLYDNGIPQTVDWSFGGSSPADNDDFTVTYDKKVYHLEYDVVETRKGQVTDASGDVYNEDADYVFVDYNSDDDNDAISWNSDPATLYDGEEFYVPYLTEGDVHFDSREKADPDADRIRVTSRQ